MSTVFMKITFWICFLSLAPAVPLARQLRGQFQECRGLLQPEKTITPQCTHKHFQETTYLAVLVNHNVFESPLSRGTLLQMRPVRQFHHIPSSQDVQPTVFPPQFGQGATSNSHGQFPVTRQLPRERNDGGGMSDQQDASMVLVRVETLQGGNDELECSAGARVGNFDGFAFARRVPAGGPRGVDMGEMVA